MEIPLLGDMIFIFSLAVAILLLCNRLGLPSLVGFLITGVLSGPHGFGFVNAVDEVENLAKIGIVLLLFTIGLEFSLKKLSEIKRYFFVGGSLQVFLTVFFGFVIAKLLERPTGEALFLGFLLSMSSTAIVLKVLEAKDEAETPYGQLSLGILIFQDIIAVPMLVVTPIIAQDSAAIDLNFILHLIKGCVIILVTFLASIKIIPWIFYHITKVRSRELFLLSVLTVCFAVAGLSSSFGLSLSMGAFLAGLLISDSEYSHEAMGTVVPLRDLFSSVFFISIGMLLDVEYVFQQPFLVLTIALAVMLLKGLIVGFTAYYMGMPLRILVIAAIALCQVGEFSFVIARTGIDFGLATEDYYQLFLAIAIITMVISPSLIDLSPRIIKALLWLPLPEKIKVGLRFESKKTHEKISKHVVVIGYGIAGRNLVRASKDASIPYLVLEMNSQTVAKEKKNGEPIFFGDATHEEVLKFVNVPEAQVVAVVINDFNAAAQVVQLVRKMNPQAYLIVRTRYVKQMEMMYHLGANDVISEEYGSSIEIFMRVLQRYEVPQENIAKFVSSLKAV